MLDTMAAAFTHRKRPEAAGAAAFEPLWREYRERVRRLVARLAGILPSLARTLRLA